MEVGLVTAFLGGALALLSPCGALLLPAFFASTFGSRGRLLLHTGIFSAGLLTVLVPLGVGAGAAGMLFMDHRGAIVIGASILMILLGVAQIFGLGFDAARFVPGAGAVQQRAATSTGMAKTFLLGAAGAIAGFCVGPILGAVLTLAATQASVLAGAILLVVYGAGMVVPLLGLALLWRKLGPRGRSALRGRQFEVAGRRFHTTSVLTGAVIVVVGVLFWTTNGFLDAPGLVPQSALYAIQSYSSVLADPVYDLVAVLALLVIVFAVWVRIRAKNARDRSADPEVV